MWTIIGLVVAGIVLLVVGFIIGACWMAFYNFSSEEEDEDLHDRNFYYSMVSQKQKGGNNSVQVQVGGIETVIGKAKTGERE